jgi:DNA-binding winged helix-turn-helix (wHTH) protein
MSGEHLEAERWATALALALARELGARSPVALSEIADIPPADDARDLLRTFVEGGGCPLPGVGLCQPAGGASASGAVSEARLTTALPAGRASCQGLVIDLASRAVTHRGNAVLGLRRKEYELLVHLIQEPFKVYSVGELLRDVWGHELGIQSRTAHSHASRLRAKLKAAGAEGFVRNVWGVGYQLCRVDPKSSSLVSSTDGNQPKGRQG